MGKMKVQKLPCAQELASLYRSVVGCGIYLSQERPDVAFTIKELAGSMANPNQLLRQQLLEDKSFNATVQLQL